MNDSWIKLGFHIRISMILTTDTLPMSAGFACKVVPSGIVIRRMLLISICEAFNGWDRTVDAGNGNVFAASCEGPTNTSRRLVLSRHFRPDCDATMGRDYLVTELKLNYPEGLSRVQQESLLKVTQQTDPVAARFEVEMVDPEAHVDKSLCLEYIPYLGCEES